MNEGNDKIKNLLYMLSVIVCLFYNNPASCINFYISVTTPHIFTDSQTQVSHLKKKKSPEREQEILHPVDVAVAL